MADPDVRVRYFGGTQVSTHPQDCRCGCVPWARAPERVKRLLTRPGGLLDLARRTGGADA